MTEIDKFTKKVLRKIDELEPGLMWVVQNEDDVPVGVLLSAEDWSDFYSDYEGYKATVEIYEYIFDIDIDEFLVSEIDGAYVDLPPAVENLMNAFKGAEVGIELPDGAEEAFSGYSHWNGMTYLGLDTSAPVREDFGPVGDDVPTIGQSQVDDMHRRISNQRQELAKLHEQLLAKSLKIEELVQSRYYWMSVFKDAAPARIFEFATQDDPYNV